MNHNAVFTFNFHHWDVLSHPSGDKFEGRIKTKITSMVQRHRKQIWTHTHG